MRLRSAGVQPANFEFVDPLTWTATDLREKQNMLRDLVMHMREIGTPKEHSWRGVQLETVLPTDIDRLVAVIPGIVGRMQRLMAATGELARLLQYGSADTALDASTVAQFGQRLVKAPSMDRRSMGDDVWHERREDIDGLIETGKKLAACQRALQTTVVEVGWSTDVAKIRRDLATHGRSWLRILYRDYRHAQATLRGILIDAVPKPLVERLRILDQLIQGQKALQILEGDSSNQDLGQRAFGDRWRGTESDWSALEQITQWEAECRQANMPDNFRKTTSEVNDVGAINDLVRRVAKDMKPLVVELQELFKRLKLDLVMAFGRRDVLTISLAMLKERLETWESDPETVTKWIAYFARWRRLESHGMGPLAERLDQGLIAATDALDRFQMAYYEELIREAFRRFPDLAAFHGVSHEQVLARFKALDLERLKMARQEVCFAYFHGLPTSGGDVGEVGIVRREMKKKGRHLPLRKLLQQAGHAVQAIKPVFMMSPISIAQYLEAGVLEFDLLVIDEASQVRPVDALGAIARSRRMVVVGDDKQLPPSRFFSRVVGEEGEATDAEDFQAGDLESILGLCEAQNMSQQMLQWHYRSRHHSLIAVSNHEFYGDELFVVPSPFKGGSELGLKFHHVKDGIFDRGGSATNRVEAQTVADAVMEHARKNPDKTLGVGTFSAAQRDAILDEVELRRRESLELESFFATAVAEPFFVKNLENIQGDERDVIFISIGYGKDASDYMSMSFGPLNNEGGERRLNVLITRARERCEVFSSITADDIDLRRTQARGPQSLKTFLKYANTGFLDVATVTDRGFDSDFEREVAKAIIRQGCAVDCLVGVAGFFVDLAVVDPDCPGRYLLGIECDGASYHSSRSARDRDRLRQQVLEDRGWIIHRIWSTDWFHRPEEQLRKVLAAVEDAKAVWASRSAPSQEAPKRTAPKKPETIDRHENESDGEPPETSVETIPYIEADFTMDATCEIHELPVEQLATVVVQIVKIEGPVHQDEVARRVASIWGLKRTGRRIADAVETALAEAAYRGQIIQSGLFFELAGQRSVPIRNRENVASANLRKPDFIPPKEVQTALVAVVQTHLGVPIDEMATEIARLFGFKSTSAQLRQFVQDESNVLTEQEVLERRNGKLYARHTMSKVLT